MIDAVVIGLLMVQAAQAPAGEAAAVDPLSVFSGDWQVVNTATGAVAMDCKHAQRFAVAPDRKTVVLTEKGAANWSARYMVLRRDRNRILMFIENEDRMTEAGDPILWWAYFDGPDRFRWRQYDWPRDSRTGMEWRRCPSD
jgi:hypothetical protein